MSYFGFDPEVPAGYQDADIEMLELAEMAANPNPNAWKCEYSTCVREAYRRGVCRPHYLEEKAEAAASGISW